MFLEYTPIYKSKLLEVFKENIPEFFAIHELKEFEDYLEIHFENYFVIEEKDIIIGGFGYELREDDKSGRINWIFIHPSFKGKGYGKEAVLFCINKLKNNSSIQKLVVRTSQFAYPFFKNLGYQLIKIEKNYWAKGLDLYLMEQNLNN
ncbi:MAG: GNAT family N-acetyltransferase [Bacteroidia bacterium]|nr:GNAT family N-acetyltransferase [Bacteroidia bacterium]